MFGFEPGHQPFCPLEAPNKGKSSMASGYVKGRRSKKSHPKDEDFQEEDVWGLIDQDLGGRNPKLATSSSSSSSRHLSATPRMIPRREINNTPTKEYNNRSSAPLSIPITMLHGNGSSWVVDEDDDDGGGGHDGDSEDDIVPPHEYIARRLARTQISSFSVCEGVGRKLKGRDLSEVRNDVLRKTGFLER